MGGAEESWVEVREYDPSWPRFYDDESAKIAAALGDYAAAIEHFGSTSVPGLAAKPIVDILVGTEKTGVPESVQHAFRDLGYEYLGEDGRRPGRFFWRKRAGHAFNVSVVPANGALWIDNLLVRDFLRTHPEWVETYAIAKRDAAAASPGSMLGYQDGKRDFVEQLKSAARDWSETHDAS